MKKFLITVFVLSFLALGVYAGGSHEEAPAAQTASALSPFPDSVKAIELKVNPSAAYQYLFFREGRPQDQGNPAVEELETDAKYIIIKSPSPKSNRFGINIAHTDINWGDGATYANIETNGWDYTSNWTQGDFVYYVFNLRNMHNFGRVAMAIDAVLLVIDNFSTVDPPGDLGDITVYITNFDFSAVAEPGDAQEARYLNAANGYATKMLNVTSVGGSLRATAQ